MKLSCICLLASFLGAAENPRVNPYAGHPQEIKAGEKLYRRHCASCHEASEQAPRLSPGSTAMSADELYRLLRNGRLRRGMPSWAQLPSEQRWQIIAWLAALP